MNNTDDYLAALRHELADLPPEELEDVMQDVTPQLLESDPAELSSPAEYAAELRAAAGYERGPDRVVARLALAMLAIGTVTAGYGGLLGDHLVSDDPWSSISVVFLAMLASAWPVRRFGPALRDVVTLPEVAAVRPAEGNAVTGYLKSLLPGWFAVHGLVIGLAGYRIISQFGSGHVVATVFAVVLIGLFTAVGQRSLRDRRWLWASLPASAYAIGFVVNQVMYTLTFR